MGRLRGMSHFITHVSRNTFFKRIHLPELYGEAPFESQHGGEV
jgi:hypothetical protein